MPKQPRLYIITGANGAGKSTVGFSYLPTRYQDNYEIFDGDKLFMQRQRELYLEKKISLKRARDLALEWLFEYFEARVSNALKSKDHFIYEGHLPEEENWSTPKRFKDAGYQIHLLFFGLKDTDVSELRVMDRARLGGHNVPLYEIERNFYGNLRMLNQKFGLLDEVKIIDTSETTNPKVFALLKNGQITKAVKHAMLPDWFEFGLSNIYEKIIENEGKR